MNVEGITWHTIALEPEPFAATKALLTETFGLAPAMDTEGFAMFSLPNGTMLELYAPPSRSRLRLQRRRRRFRL